MPTSPYKVKFNMGENATNSNPPIEAGQIVLDKAEDKQCLFVDVDDSTRLQVEDPTKMDKWGEVITTSSMYHVQPYPNTVIGQVTYRDEVPIKLSGILFQQTDDGTVVGVQNADLSDETYQTMVQLYTTLDGIAGSYYNTEQGNISLNVGTGTLGVLQSKLTINHNKSPIHYIHEFGVDSTNLTWYMAHNSYPIENMKEKDIFTFKVGTNAVHIECKAHDEVDGRNLSFFPDTDTRQFLVRGVCTPKEDVDAANKQYVDSKVSEVQTTWIDW